MHVLHVKTYGIVELFIIGCVLCAQSKIINYVVQYSTAYLIICY